MCPKLKSRKYSVNAELTNNPANSKELMEKEKRFDKVAENEK
jgi:hypothetical protein